MASTFGGWRSIQLSYGCLASVANARTAYGQRKLRTVTNSGPALASRTSNLIFLGPPRSASGVRRMPREEMRMAARVRAREPLKAVGQTLPELVRDGTKLRTSVPTQCPPTPSQQNSANVII